MSVRTFMTSFFDGFTLAGIFGDLRIPGAPNRIFKEEGPEHEQVIEEGGESDEGVKLQGSGEKREDT